MKKIILITVLLLFFIQPSFAGKKLVPVFLEDNQNVLYGSTKMKEIYSLDSYIESKYSSSSAIDVITKDDIDKQNNPSFAQILSQVGSVTIQNSNGSDGSITSVRIRGTDRVRYTIDGIRADRPSMTTCGVEAQFFLTEDMERIEVIKGPQGNILGTNASGGAIAVETRRGRGPLSIELGSDFGNYSSFKERFAIMAGDEKKDFYFATTWYKTDGGMFTSKLGRIYNDDYNNLNVVANVGHRLFDGRAEIRDVFRFSRARKGIGIGYHDWTGVSYNDPNNYGKNIDIFNSLNFKHSPTDFYNYNVRFGIYHNQTINRTIPDDVCPDNYENSNIYSTRLNFMTQHNLKYKNWNTLSLGYNLETEFINSDTDGSRYTTYPSKQYYSDGYSGSSVQNDIYLNDVINVKDKLFIRGGARLLYHSNYGLYITPNVSAALVLPTFKIPGATTKIRGSWGQSVNTPTLYQRYGTADFGYYHWIPNPNLKAEKFMSWDVGIEQGFFNNKLNLEFGYFNSDYKDFIAAYTTSDWTKGYYKNISSARIQGYEAKLTYAPNEKFKFVLSYTYTDSQDKSTGYDLPSTPRNRFGGTIYWTPCERFNMYFGLEASSSRTITSANNDSVPGFVDARIGASLRLFTYKGASVYLRANIYNLFNQKICMYKSNDDYYYAPKIRCMIGLFIKYNLPEKEKV